MTGDDSKRTLGLAAILVIGTIAGFLAAVGTGGAAYETVGTIGSESQAFQMPIAEEDQRVLFTLEAGSGTTVEPAATFALYDPADSFMTEIELSGDGDEAEAILDQQGPWVLFLTEQRNSELTVAYEGLEEEESSNVQLEQLAVKEEQTVVEEQNGGALDDHFVRSLDTRPATVFLELEGDIEDLDATVESEEGLVYELTDASATTNENGTERAGDATLVSENLAAGTYEVTSTAAEFDGKLLLTHQIYEREDVVHEDPSEPVDEEITPYTEANDGVIVAEVQEGQAFEVDTAGMAAMTFIAEEDTSANLLVYNETNRFLDEIRINEDADEHDKDKDKGGESESSAPTNQTVETVAFEDSSDTFVVYAQHVQPSDSQLLVFVETEEASPAEQLDIETQEITLSGNDDSENVTLDGAVLDIYAYNRDVASTERNITVTGEAGPILHYEQRLSTLGASLWYEHEVHQDRFTDGEIDAAVSGSGIAGQTYVDIVHYVR